MQTRTRVVIVGAGFGGLAAARGLGRESVDLTVIDRRNHHLFQPLLYQVATAGLNPSDIAYPIRSVLRDQENTRVLLAEVVGVDLAARSVSLDDGSTQPYDQLIVATGVTHAYFGHDEWEPDAPGLKTIEDALEIRRRLLSAFEAAERTDDPAEQSASLTFIVVGGGPTGVEMAGAIAEIATQTLARDFRHIDPTTARVVLVEGLDRILSTYPPKLSGKAEDQLRALGVEVQTSTRVVGVDRSGVDTDKGRIDARTVVWGAGVKGSGLGRALTSNLDRAGRVPVEADLSLPGHPEVLVIGDLAAVTVGGKPVPGVAPAAIQAGAHAARVVKADQAGRSRPAFRYRDKGSLATIGRSRAVADFGRVRVSGLVAWVMWWAIHIAFLIGFRSRVLVMFGWGWAWLTFQRGARLITTRWQPGPPAPTDGKDEGR
jgi:NADH dehydrogenase